MTDLTPDYVRSILNYDQHTGVFTWKIWRGGSAKQNSKAGKLERSGYVRIRIGTKLYLGHRLAWFYTYGVWPLDCIDHVNRNRADNRLVNLRLATYSENAENGSVRVTNSSGVPGVSWKKHQNKWRVYITKNYKQIHIGYFSDLNDAIQARINAISVHHKYKASA